MRSNIYIIHAPEDADIANEIRNGIHSLLASREIECSAEPKEIRERDSETAALRNIEESQVVVVIFSSNANSSRLVERQLRHAVELNKYVILFCVEELEPTASQKELFLSVEYVIRSELLPKVRLFLLAERIRVLNPEAESIPSFFSYLGLDEDRAEETNSTTHAEPGRADFAEYAYSTEYLPVEKKEKDRAAKDREMKAAAAQGSPVKGPAVQPAGWWRPLFRRQAGRAIDRVDCSIFAPSMVAPAESFLVQVFAHLRDEAEAARKLAIEFDREAERRGKKTLEAQIQQGTSLTFHLVMPGLSIIGPVQSLNWWGSTESVQFEVNVPEDCKDTTIIGTVNVCSENVPVGHIKFKVSIGSTVTADASPQLAGDTAQMYRRAFISYATQDRTEVLKRVQMLSRLNIDFFQDVLSLEPGARWEKELYRHIDESDLFLLFWSSAAKESKWVLEEIRYALNRKGGDDLTPPEILPVIIEGPPPIEPPKELAHLHFNDYLVYFMAK